MKTLILFILGIVSMSVFVTSCENAEENPGYEFHYYPKKNVYYDVESKNFLYSLNAANSWTSFANVHNNDPQNLGERVVIHSADKEIFKNNEAHRKSYQGVSLQLVNEDSTASRQTEEVSERKPVEKKKSAAKPAKTKDKKGIGKIINKIFGKSNK